MKLQPDIITVEITSYDKPSHELVAIHKNVAIKVDPYISKCWADDETTQVKGRYSCDGFWMNEGCFIPNTMNKIQ